MEGSATPDEVAPLTRGGIIGNMKSSDRFPRVLIHAVAPLTRGGIIGNGALAPTEANTSEVAPLTRGGIIGNIIRNLAYID